MLVVQNQEDMIETGTVCTASTCKTINHRAGRIVVPVLPTTVVVHTQARNVSFRKPIALVGLQGLLLLSTNSCNFQNFAKRAIIFVRTFASRSANKSMCVTASSWPIDQAVMSWVATSFAKGSVLGNGRGYRPCRDGRRSGL